MSSYKLNPAFEYTLYYLLKLKAKCDSKKVFVENRILPGLSSEFLNTPIRYLLGLGIMPSRPPHKDLEAAKVMLLNIYFMESQFKLLLECEKKDTDKTHEGLKLIAEQNEEFLDYILNSTSFSFPKEPEIDDDKENSLPYLVYYVEALMKHKLFKGNFKLKDCLNQFLTMCKEAGVKGIDGDEKVTFDSCEFLRSGYSVSKAILDYVSYTYNDKISFQANTLQKLLLKKTAIIRLEEFKKNIPPSHCLLRTLQDLSKTVTLKGV